MRKILLVLIGIFSGISSNVWAQDSLEVRQDLFLKLKTGQTLRGEIEKNEPIFSKDYLLLNDSLRIDLDRVQTYATDDGYFTRITDESSLLHYQKFAKRVEKGKIDLYSREYVGGGAPIATFGSYGGASVSAGVGSSSARFFSVNGKDVLKANYRNLKGPLSDNPESMKHLTTYHDMGIASWVMIAGGLAIFGGSLTTISDEGGLPAGVFVGLGITVGGSIMGFARQPYLPKAIEAYNE